MRLPHPFDCIFLSLFNIADALEDISDVIDPSLLYFESSHCKIEIERQLWRFSDQFHKFLCQHGQTIILPTFL